VIEDKAILQWPESHRFITTPEARGRDVITGIEITGEAKVLWPAERNIEYLLKERHIVGSVMFSREFQNEVQDDSAAAFRMAWLNAALERGKHMSLYEIPDVPGLEIVQGWDLALVTDAKHAESRDTDYTVGVTWARDASGNRYLLGLRRERGLTPAKIEGVVKSEFARFGLRVRSIAVERNNFGELIYLGLQTNTDLPLKGHITGRNKADPWEGVPAMGVLFENGKVIIPSRTEEDRTTVEPLINELWGLGREIHDDTVMSLWIAETVLRTGSFVHRVSFSDDDEIYGAADDRMHRADGQWERSAPTDEQPYADEHVQALWNSLPIGQGDG
jgi:phage terminase large subunit-like protein